MGIFLRRRDYDCIDVRRQVAIGVSHGLLIIKVGHIPDSPNYMPDAELFAKIHRQTVITHDPDAGKVFGGLGYYVLTLLHREKTFLGLIDTDRHDNLVEDCQGPGQYIQVTRGKRIERAWE